MILGENAFHFLLLLLPILPLPSPPRLTLMEMTAGTFPKLSSTQLPFSLMRATTAEAMNSTRLPLLTRITVLTLKCPADGQSHVSTRAGSRHPASRSQDQSNTQGGSARVTYR
jgi:hypothetical protein